MTEESAYEKLLSRRRAREQEKAIMQEPESKGKHITSTSTAEELQHAKFYAADSPEAKAIIAKHDARIAAQKKIEDDAYKAQLESQQARMQARREDEENADDALSEGVSEQAG